MIKDKKRKDELKAQLDQLHRFLKDLSSPISIQSTTPKTPVLLSKKEDDDLVKMRSKVKMLDRWTDRLNQEVEELLVEIHKVHKEVLESVNDMITYPDIL